MKLSVNFSDITLEDRYITPSELIELSYCPRFIYFMHCLDISQKEENRYLVQLGLETHRKRASSNKNHLSKKLNVVDKKIDVDVQSNEYMLKGKIDELLFINDGKEACILDYKNSVYKDTVYDTLKSQMAAYTIMAKETYNIEVDTAYIVFLQNRKTVEVNITNKDVSNIKELITMYTKILYGYYPKPTNVKSICIDCCYKNICIK